MPMGIGLGIGVTRGGAPAFSPASLFAASEPGVWYDPSDFSTMFQNSAGTTPVTAVEQPVGLLLDKSKGLVLGPELVTNGDFSNGTTGWTNAGGGTFTVSGGVATFSRSTLGDNASTAVTCTTGMAYKITVTVVSVSGAAGRVVFNAAPVGSATTGTVVDGAAPGTYTAFVTATASTMYLSLASTANGSLVQYDNISVKELSGNHATQATSASRPVLSARVNLLLATATLSTQSVTTLAATYTLSFTGAGTVTLSGTATGTYSAGTNSITCTAGTLTLTVSGAVTLADLRVANTGVGLPAYQTVVTSTDYDTTGFPYYLRFDGTDDGMATSTITPGIDKAQVFAGVRKQSDAATGALAEFSTTWIGNIGSFILTAPGTTAPSGNYDSASRGNIAFNANQGAATGTIAAPTTNVITATHDIAGDITAIRSNGVQIATATGDKGTGNFLAYPLYIGRRGGTTLPFNGNLYSLIVRFGANLDAATISNTETWVNGKALAY